LQNGGTLPEIQQAIGHTTLNMTRRYAHLETKASAAKLARILTATTASLTVP
jgi:site-specific recombinase XerD